MRNTSAKQLRYTISKKILNTPNSNILFRAITKHYTPHSETKIKFICKHLFYLIAIQSYRALNHQMIINQPLCYFQHRSENNKRNMWHSYEKKLFNEKNKHVEWIDYNKPIFRLVLPTIKIVKQTNKALQNIRRRDARALEQILLWIDIYNSYQTAQYHLRLAKQHQPTYFVAADSGTFPESIYFEYYKSQGIPTYSAQLFNLSEDNMFKPDTESVWLNMQCETFYVWGSTYQKFLQSKRPDVSFPIIGHPLYKNLKSVKPRPDHVICLALNPKQPKQISYDWLELIEDYCSKHQWYFSIRIHPLDQIEQYTMFTQSPYFIPLNKKTSCWYMVNNSTVYYDLIRDGEWAIRYRHSDTYLPLPELISDSISTMLELHTLIINSSPKEIKIKQKEICCSMFEICNH